MRESRLFFGLLAALLASLFASGCGGSGVYESGVEPGHDERHTGPTVAPKPRTVFDDSVGSTGSESLDHQVALRPWSGTESAPASPLPRENPFSDAPWSLPNGTYHSVVLIDVSASLSASDIKEAGDITVERIRSVTGGNKVTVYLVGTSYLRWPSASSDAERAALADSVRDYLGWHAFSSTELAYTNYELALLDALENGFLELKESGTRFHITVVGDGWNQAPKGQDSESIQEHIRSCMSRISEDRRHLFTAELISVYTRDREYEGEEHLRDVFRNPDFPVYAAASWKDVAARFAAIDRELSGSYSWVNAEGPVLVAVSDTDELYSAGAHLFSLDAPTRSSGELFTAVLSAPEGEYSNAASDFSGHWKVRGSDGEPVPFSEGLRLSDGAEVEIYVSLNRGSVFPGDVFWPLERSLPFEVRLVPHSSVSLALHGERPNIIAMRDAWLYRNWFPERLVIILATAVSFLLLLRWEGRRIERIYSAPRGPAKAAQDDGDVVGHVSYRGTVMPIRHTWVEVGNNITVVPTPDGIFVHSRIPSSMFSIAGAASGHTFVPMPPGKMCPLAGGAVEIRDAGNEVYQVNAVAVPSAAADIAAPDDSDHEVLPAEVYT